MCNGPPLVRFELGGAAVGQGRTSHDCLTISPYLVREARTVVDCLCVYFMFIVLRGWRALCAHMWAIRRHI